MDEKIFDDITSAATKTATDVYRKYRTKLAERVNELANRAVQAPTRENVEAFIGVHTTCMHESWNANPDEELTNIHKADLHELFEKVRAAALNTKV